MHHVASYFVRQAHHTTQYLSFQIIPQQLTERVMEAREDLQYHHFIFICWPNNIKVGLLLEAENHRVAIKNCNIARLTCRKAILLRCDAEQVC